MIPSTPDSSGSRAAQYIRHDFLQKIMRPFIVMALLFNGLAYGAEYTLINLGRLPGTNTASPAWPGKDINNLGEVVGASGNLPFLYTHGQMQQLPSLSSGKPFDITGGAYGINDKGEVVGTSSSNFGSIEMGFSLTVGFYYDGHAIKSLDTLPPTGGVSTNTTPYSINNNGQIAGFRLTHSINGIEHHAVVFTNGQIQDLGTLPGADYSEALAINNNGVVVGNSGTSGFQYSNGKMEAINPAPGYFNSDARAINDAGVIVGSTLDSSGLEKAYFYENGKMTIIGTLPGFTESQADGINNLGQIVGSSWNDVTNQDHPFLYSHGKMTDLFSLLDDPPYYLRKAYSINDKSQISAYGGGYAYLLSPVPENGTFATLLLGLVLFGVLRKRGYFITDFAPALATKG